MSNGNSAFLVPKLLSDEPLDHDEKSSFQRDAYAATLAGLIASADTRAPMTIAVHGSWGSGKTSLMRKVQGILQDPQNNGFAGDRYLDCKTVWFEAWRYAKQDEMLVALSSQVLKTMESGGFLDSVRARLDDPQQKEFNLFGFTTSAITQILSLGRINLDPANYQTESAFRRNLAFYDQFQEFLTQLIDKFVAGQRGGRLVVFIDDLDRCIPSKIVQVLESVKLFLNTPSCLFVLGADADVVASAVQAHYDGENLRDFNGREYLDKIIQVQFPLPPISPANMTGYIQDISGHEEAQPYLGFVAQTIPTNPRRIKTFLNHIELQWSVLRNGGLGGNLEKDRLVEWLILGQRKGGFCDYVVGLPNDAERVQSLQMLKQIADGRHDSELPDDSPLSVYAADQELLRIFQLGDFTFDEETVSLCLHLAPAPRLEAPASVAEPSMSGMALSRDEALAAVREGRSLLGATLSGTDLSGADLSGADLRRADLRRADLSGADLRRANLRRADLRRADLSGADLNWAYLREANLSWAYLNGANLSWAELIRANLEGAIFDADRIDLSQTLNWRRARWDAPVLEILLERYGEDTTQPVPSNE